VSGGEWNLEANAEREILLPWAAETQTDEVVARVYDYLADLLMNPWRPHLEDDDTGIFSIRAVPGTGVGLVWTLNDRHRQVVLAYVGSVPTGG
jgi:hypothetical protein